MVDKIVKILEDTASRIRAKSDFWFDIPKRELKYLDYRYSLAMPLLRRGHNARRSFSNNRTKHQACLTVWLLNHLLEAVKGGFVLTEREIYYNNKMLFRNPNAVAKALTDICCLLECTTTSLNVIPRREGTVIGKLVLTMFDTEVVDFTNEQFIPLDIRKINQFAMDKSVEFILVVEKGTMLDTLKRVGFHESHKCIIVCGHGVPDERTRGFVRMLEERFEIPIYGITDPDPYGCSIMKVYAKGSINLAHCNMSLAANSIHWLGICSLDIENMGPDAQQKVRSRCKRLKPKEIIMLRIMMDVKYRLSTLWIRRIKHMLNWNRKPCFEDLNALGRDYAARVHIPYLINHVKDNMLKINGNGSTSNNDPLIAPSSRKIPTFSFEELSQKTNNFGLDALIEDGPNGKLYRAVLTAGEHVVVERLNDLAGPQPNRELLEHVHTVSILEHENIVGFLGHCEGDKHLLVYESATMGNLHDLLHGATSSILGWDQRVKIAVDVARGLEYLHKKSQCHIVHGDIRSSNVLLFENYKAKIADFKPQNQKPTLDSRNKDYHAPEYVTGQLTQKCDVYSFGIVLLELLTGKNPLDKVEGLVNFACWGTQKIEKGRELQCVDPRLSRIAKPQEAREKGPSQI